MGAPFVLKVQGIERIPGDRETFWEGSGKAKADSRVLKT